MRNKLKKCTKCGEIKLLTEFYKRKDQKNNLRSNCKACHITAGLKWRANNSKRAYETAKKRRANNKERFYEYDKKWGIEHKERKRMTMKKWYNEHRKYQIKIARKWAIEHPEKRREIGKKAGAKMRSTLKGRLNNRMSSNIGQSLKGSKAGHHWEDLVGYTIDRLKKHLEKLFKPGMTWENYGKIWEIDHIIPKSKFNFSKPEHLDFKRCWGLKNLRPLEIRKNRSKHNKIDKPFQPSLLIQL